MAKRKTNKLLTISKYIKIAVIAVLLVALLAPLGPAITWTVRTATGYMSSDYGSGFNFMFSNIIRGNIEFKSTLNAICPLIAWILVAISFVLTVISLFTNKSKFSFVLTPLVMVLLIASAILSLSSHKEVATVLANALTGTNDENIAETIYKNTTLNFGIIGCGIFSAIGAFSCLVNLFFSGTVDKVRSKVKK